MSYETPVKLTHRATVLELYHVCSAPKLPIVYVDDDLASAPLYFLAKGVPKKHLKPINYSASACTSIEVLSGVQATCLNAAAKAVETKCGVLWLDVQCKSVSRQVFARSNCKYLMLTLSTRGSSPDGIIGDAVGCMKKEGLRVLETSRYQGKSNITNVVKIIATSQRPLETRVAPLVKSDTHLRKACVSMIGKTVFIPTKQLKHGYESVTKVKQGKYVFRVTSTYHKKRLAVQRLLPNNSLSKDKEPWTLTPDDVERYQ